MGPLLKVFFCEGYSHWPDLDDNCVVVANTKEEALGLCLTWMGASCKSDWEITEVDPTKFGMHQGVY